MTLPPYLYKNPHLKRFLSEIAVSTSLDPNRVNGINYTPSSDSCSQTLEI